MTEAYPSQIAIFISLDSRSTFILLQHIPLVAHFGDVFNLERTTNGL